MVNGQIQTLPQVPKTVNGTTMLSVRFVAENLKCNVQYKKDNQTIFVTSDDIIEEKPSAEGIADAEDREKTVVQKPVGNN